MITKRAISNPYCKEFQKLSLQILQPPQPEEGVLWISGKNIIGFPVGKTYVIRIPMNRNSWGKSDSLKKPFAFPPEFQVELMLYAFMTGKVEEFPWNTLIFNLFWWKEKQMTSEFFFTFYRSSPRSSPSTSLRPFSRFTVRKTVPDIIIGQTHDIFSRILRTCKFLYQLLCNTCFDFFKG